MSTSSTMLSICDLRFWAHLGYTIEERSFPQLVRCDITVEFKAPPEGMTTDNLEHTLCYASLVEAVHSATRGRFFSLVEHLGGEVHKSVSYSLGEKADIISLVTITIRKERVPIQHVYGGAVFTHRAPPRVA